MRINRRFLYWGIFFVAIGIVLVAADAGAVETPTLTDALRLWPLAVIAIGLSLVLRRTQLGLPVLLLAAALPGLVLGSAFAVAPRFVGDCGGPGEPATVASNQGTFDGPASVSIRTACGSLNVTTAAGNGWQLDAANSSGRVPSIQATAQSLSVEGSSHDVPFFDGGRDAWNLTLPTSELDAVSLVVFAGRAQVDLPGAAISGMAVTVNAAEVAIDASAASMSDLSAVVNLGSLSVDLPAASDLVGSLRVGAGELRICAPPGLGLHVRTSGTAEQVRVNGLPQRASEWQSPDYATATHHADLRVSGNFGSVEINPIGGCK
jgi:hypothetical protein